MELIQKCIQLKQAIKRYRINKFRTSLPALLEQFIANKHGIYIKRNNFINNVIDFSINRFNVLLPYPS